MKKTLKTGNRQKLSCTVAMCTYNGSQFLEEQLFSLTKQTRLPDELVVCDDDSNDRTFQILEDFAKTAPFPVKISRNSKNLGYIKNFEKCTLLTSGDVVFFCDQDDIWMPDKIEKIMHVFEVRPDVGLVLNNNSFIDAHNHPICVREKGLGMTKLPREKLAHELKEHSTLFFITKQPGSWSGCCMAYRRKWNDLITPFITQIPHDCWCLHCLGICANVVYLDEKLNQYRRHAGNVTIGPRKPFRFWRKLWNSIKKRWYFIILGGKRRDYIIISKKIHERFDNYCSKNTNSELKIAHPELLSYWK